jgi:tellurite resistance protein
MQSRGDRCSLWDLMKIETVTIARLRDALLQSGRRPSMILSPAYEILARQGLLSPEEMAALERVDSHAEVMYLMMAADGQVTDVERDAVRGAIRGLTGNLLRSGTIDTMLANYATRLAEQGRDLRLQEIAETLSDVPVEAESAFSLAAAIALADDEVAEEENAFINQLAEWFGLSQERANAILDALDDDHAD